MITQYVNHKNVGILLIILSIVFGGQVIGFAEVTPVSDRTSQVRDAIVSAVPNVNAASDVTETHLAAITRLNLRSKGITALKSGDFSGLSGLTDLNLYGNQLSSLPNGIFEGLTALTTLRLGGNTTNPMLLTVSLEKVGDNHFKAVASIGAPFAIVLPVSATNGSISGDATTLTISKGSVESDAVTVTRTEGTTAAVTVNIGTLPAIPNDHYGYNLSKSDALPVEVISAESTPTIPSGADEIDTATPAITPPPVTPVTPDPPDEVPENNAPTFTEGAITKRSVAENTAANTNIGTAVSATDSDSGDTLSYTLGGVDASFDIDSATGQLKTKAALDYETKRVYAVSITVSDGSLRDTISVIISVINKADTVLDTSILSVSDRTPQVRDAIVAAVPGVTDAADVTATHLAAITSLNLRSNGITSLKIGDFSGLTGMTSLNLYSNMLSSFPYGIFEGLTSLMSLRLGGNTVSPMPLIVWLEQVSNDMYKVSIPAGAPFDVAVRVVLVDGELRETLRTVTISKGSVKSAAFTVPIVGNSYIVIGDLPTLPANHYGYVLSKSGTCSITQQVAEAIAAAVPGVTDCRNVSETDLAIITSLNLNNKSITSLRSDDFAALLSLTSLDLRNNQLSSLPDGIFAGLTRLTTVQLSGNTGAPFSLEVSLEKVGTNMVRATIRTGAPFDIVLPVSINNGSLAGNASSVTISTGRVRSMALLVTRTPNTTGAVTANIGTMPSIPATHNGYTLAKSTVLPLEIFRNINVAPVFTAGVTTTRSIAENTAADTNIGSAISATDANSGDTLTYTLSGADASSFSIVSTSGQLQAKAALDYETKSSYTVTITVSDGTATDSITVTINVTDVDENRAPIFTSGDKITRSIAENTASGVNIGTTVSATDADSDTLTYSLGGTDTASFAIDTKSGQLKTSAALDYETKSSYSVTITVSDGSLTDIISVTINITDVDEYRAPVFSDGDKITRSIAENTASGVNIGTTVSATDADSDTLTYSLGGTDAVSFAIDTKSGQLKTSAALDYETKSSYSVTITVSDGSLTDIISITIKVTDVDEKPATDDITTRNVTTPMNNAPVFTDGESATRTVAENTSSGVNIGSAVTATDAEGHTLTYSLSGTDAAAFSIDSSSGQLRTSASLDYETKSTYTVTIIVSDGTLTDSITVTIKVTDVDETPSNNAPVFSDGDSTTLTVAENTSSGVNIGSAVSATDTDDDTLTYSLGGTDSAAFSIDSSSGQLRTSASLDYETKSTYTVTITVSDGTLTDSITVTIKVTDVDETLSNNAPTLPTFSDGNSTPAFASDSTTRSVAENTGSGVNIGSAVSATDTDDDTLTYSLGGTDAAAFSIDSTLGQLRTKSALDYETKTSYTVTITVSDDSLMDSITVTINITDVTENSAPVFTDGASTTRSIAENTAAGTNIGTAVAATDADNDELTYTLGGTNAASFSIVSTSGQLKTRSALDYETKSSYSVTISVSDGNGGSDSITVTINITDVTENSAPVFTDGGSVTRSIDEVNYAGTAVDTYVDLGSPINATDADNDTVTYSFVNIGDNADYFRIISSTGQLSGRRLDHETQSSFTLTLKATDSNNGSDTITVTVTINDINEVPTFSAVTTLDVQEGTAANTDLGSVYTAYDYDDDDTITFSLAGTDASSFQISSSSTQEYTDSSPVYSVYATGQLQTKASLDYATKNTYSVDVVATDTAGLTKTTSITINVVEAPDNVGEAPDPAVSSRTEAVRNAIVSAVSDVNSPSDIDGTHLIGITSLDISSSSVSSLSAGDFNGLTSLETLNLSDNTISSLPDNIFDDLGSLTSLDISGNSLTSLPDGVFSGFPSLSTLDLSSNTGNLSVVLSIEKVDHADNDASNQYFRVKANTAAPFDLTFDVNASASSPVMTITFGVIHTLTISAGSTYSDNVIASRFLPLILFPYSVEVDSPGDITLPSGHSGYSITNSDDQPYVVIPPGQFVPGQFAPSQVSNADSQLPQTTELLPNFPNPFNPETWIPYQLAKPNDVSITIYDIRGNVVRQLDTGHQKAGFYTDRSRAAHWDGRNAVGERVANGVYFYRLRAGSVSVMRKMTIVK